MVCDRSTRGAWRARWRRRARDSRQAATSLLAVASQRQDRLDRRPADGFRIESATTYTLDHLRSRCVAVDITITNQRPDQVEVAGSAVLFTREVMLMLSDPSNPASRRRKTPVSAGLRSPRFSFAVVDLQPDLYHPSSQAFGTYDFVP
jgi:hypothetical protein